MSHRIYNFSAGPAILPEPVLDEAAQGVREINGSGMSLLEVSHRGKDYEAIHADAEQRLLRVLGLSGEDYYPLFLQGGASMQFAMVPMNFLTPAQTADYVISGDWGAKALSEAKLFGDAREAATSKGEKYAEIPKDFTRTPGARYVHITTNNTIEGTEYFALPDVGDTPLVADSSSDFLALRRDYSKFSLLYAGAQKNAGPAGVTMVLLRKSFAETANPKVAKILSYATYAENRSLYNTPPTFAVYVVGLVLKWVEDQGGLEAVEARNKAEGQDPLRRAGRERPVLPGGGDGEGRPVTDERHLAPGERRPGSRLPGRSQEEPDGRPERPPQRRRLPGVHLQRLPGQGRPGPRRPAARLRPAEGLTPFLAHHLTP